MAPTTVTTIFLVLFALGVLALSAYTWLGSWELQVRRPAPQRQHDPEIEAAVRQMRRSIEDYERRHGDR